MAFDGFLGNPAWTYHTYFFMVFFFHSLVWSLSFSLKLLNSFWSGGKGKSREQISTDEHARMLNSDVVDSNDSEVSDAKLHVNSQHESFPMSEGVRRCRRCCQCAAVGVWVAQAFGWIVLCLLTVGSAKAWYWVAVCVMWVCVAAVTLYMPRTVFSQQVVRGSVVAGGFWLSVALLQLSMWSYVSPFLGWALMSVPTLIAGWWWLCEHITSMDNKDILSSRGGSRYLHVRRVCKSGTRGLAAAPRKLRLSAAAVVVGWLVYCAMVAALTAHSCMAFYNDQMAGGVYLGPIRYSSAATRWGQEHCKLGSLCHVYLTVAENVSSSVYVNAHTHAGPSSTQRVRVVYWRGENTAVGRLNTDDNSNLTAWAEPFVVTPLQGITDRTVHSAFLHSLAPAETYSFAVQLLQDDSLLDISKTFKFRTGPGQAQPFTVSVGGDAGNTGAARDINVQTAAQNPLFAIQAGDLAYDNAIPSCYACWDSWLSSWAETMVTTDGHMIPVLTTIGNHDVGSNDGQGAYFTSTSPASPSSSSSSLLPSALLTHLAPSFAPSRVPLYLYFFPHHSVPGQPTAVPPPAMRSFYHSHVVGTSSVFLCLDSGHVTQRGGRQAMWLDRTLQQFESAPLRVAAYHVPMYPFPKGEVSDKEMKARDTWVPLFDAHHLSAGFENHVHAFKRTHPLRNNVKHPNGTVYLGDGYWGISPHSDLGTGPDEGTLHTNPSSIVSVSGLRYHTWRLDVNADNSTAMLSAIGLDGLPFDSTHLPLNP